MTGVVEQRVFLLVIHRTTVTIQGNRDREPCRWQGPPLMPRAKRSIFCLVKLQNNHTLFSRRTAIAF